MAILERQLRKMLVFKSLLVASLLVSSLAQEITEQESEQKSVVKSTENSEEIKRQGPQQAGWGGLISGKFFTNISQMVYFLRELFRKSPS